MNLKKLKGNIGWRVQLTPPAIHLDEFGRELPGRNEDWIIHNVTDTEVRIDENAILGRTYRLGLDHVIDSFATNPDRSIPGGLQYGHLKLAVQLYIPRTGDMWFQHCVRPGERVPPPPVNIVELFVDSEYPTKSGIQKKLEESGYRLSWANTSRLASAELDGWEVVIEKNDQGIPRRFYLRDSRDNQVLVKKRV